MPVTDEPLKEKVPFDVYAMMLILAFLATAGSIAFINDHLQKEWYAGEQPGIDHAEHLTAHNSVMEDRENYFKWLADPKTKELVFEVEVTENDKEDFKRANYTLYGDEVELEYEPYPAYIKPLDGGVQVKPGHDNTQGVPEDVLKQMLEKYKDITAVPGEGGAAEGAAPAEGAGEGEEGAAPAEGAGATEGGATPPPAEGGAEPKAE